MREAIKRLGNLWDKFLATLSLWIFCLGFGCSVVAAVGILGFQIFVWAKSGEWISIPIAYGLALIGIDTAPIYDPTNWVGLASLARWFVDLPLSVLLPILGFLIFGSVSQIIDENAL